MSELQTSTYNLIESAYTTNNELIELKLSIYSLITEIDSRALCKDAIRAQLIAMVVNTEKDSER